MPSAARPLQDLEVAELAATATRLPDSWHLQIEAPYGQLAITPRQNAPYHTRCWIIDGQRRVCTRVPWRAPYA